METLRKIFPYSFKEKNDIGALIINILIHVVLGTILKFVLGICIIIPVIGLIASLLSKLVEIYLAVGVILSVLDYFKVLK